MEEEHQVANSSQTAASLLWVQKQKQAPGNKNGEGKKGKLNQSYCLEMSQDWPSWCLKGGRQTVPENDVQTVTVADRQRHVTT